ncbi:hypothetical protein P3T76_015079 [Phytophthora citrophthora]|nr:hypothetical protein P3T76_015079 [Phytophthora citrophthora]
MLATTCTGDVRVETLSVAEKPVSKDAAISESGSDAIDFDAVRAEYEQCEAECKEADTHIARLSSEMAALKTQLPPVDSAQA